MSGESCCTTHSVDNDHFVNSITYKAVISQNWDHIDLGMS